MITELDALKKWCPFTRHAAFGSPAINRSGDADKFGIDYNPVNKWNKCVGSDCMAWRFRKPNSEWVERELSDGSKMGSFENVPNGYCGLAGKPA